VLKKIELYLAGNYFILAVANNLNAECSLSPVPIQNGMPVFGGLKKNLVFKNWHIVLRHLFQVHKT